MSENFLLPDEARAHKYAVADFFPLKALLSDGEVTDHLPIAFSGLVPAQYDEILMGYTEGNLTQVTYKYLNTVVTVLDLSYSGCGDLTSIKKV